MREDIRKRREKYENFETSAKKLFGGKEMITERKAGMNFDHFKYMQSIQNRALKLLFKKAPSQRVAKLMVPTTPSLHLQYEIAKRRAIKSGELAEVKPEKLYKPSFLSNIFNFFRTYGKE